MLTKELLAFQELRLGSPSASLSPESLELQLFGYITLVKDGRSLGRLHAVNYWKGGTTHGKFNGVRIHPASNRSKEPQYARLLLVFNATLSDGKMHELALVRHHTHRSASKTIAGVQCPEMYLEEAGISVIFVTDIVDSWALLPDFRPSFAARDSNHFVAGNYLL